MVSRFPGYIQHVGWWKHLPSHGGQRSKDVLVYRYGVLLILSLNLVTSFILINPVIRILNIKIKAIYARHRHPHWKIICPGFIIMIYTTQAHLLEDHMFNVHDST